MRSRRPQDQCIVLACDAAYAAPTAVAIRSVLVSTPSAPDVVVIQRGLDRGQIELLCAESDTVRVVSAPEDFQLGSGVSKLSAHVSSAMFYKLLTPNLVPAAVERALYLDSDTIVRQSVTDVFEADMSSNLLAAADDRYLDGGHLSRENPRQRYFNSGVVLYDIPACRRVSLTDVLIDYVQRRSDDLEFPDQDALNVIASDCRAVLPSKWNCMLGEDIKSSSAAVQQREIAQAAILHYVGPTKPCNEGFPAGPLRQAYLHYARARPEPDRGATG